MPLVGFQHTGACLRRSDGRKEAVPHFRQRNNNNRIICVCVLVAILCRGEYDGEKHCSAPSNTHKHWNKTAAAIEPSKHSDVRDMWLMSGDGSNCPFARTFGTKCYEGDLRQQDKLLSTTQSLVLARKRINSTGSIHSSKDNHTTCATVA